MTDLTTDYVDDIALRCESLVGATLKGKWRVDALLGIGGMAAVYAATHRNNKRVAVKVLHPEFSHNPAIRQRFLREGYVANSIGHPGAVSVDDDDITDDGCAFLVMELLEGETLDARQQRKGRIDSAEVLALAYQVLDTLAAAHSQGVIHRDLKPENLFLTLAGQVKVLDFGIARVRDVGSQASSTRTGSLLGTPSFMPPEQARGIWAEVDARSDIWAVGATMFTLLTGRLVHPSVTINESLVKAVTEVAPPVGSVGVDVPDTVAALVDRALAYDKAERWASALAMQEALREVYEAITDKPITLGDAIAADIPKRDRGALPPKDARGATALDAVVSTGSPSRSARKSRQRTVGTVLGLCGSAATVGALLWKQHAPYELAQPASSAEHATASAQPTTPTPTSINASPEPARTAIPVVPIERLPLAVKTVAAAATVVPVSTDTAPSKPLGVVAAAPPHAAPVVSVPSHSSPSVPPQDPFAARR